MRLEWGAYLFTPSRKALASLQGRAAAQGDKRAVIWSADDGEKEITRLRDIETRLGQTAAFTAWKTALEDPDAESKFTTASIWAAIRERHGGVLRTPYGVLAADKRLLEQVTTDTNRNLTITAYLPRMRRSFGVLYLGLDPGQGDGAYERKSEVCNRAIMALDRHATFEQARQQTSEKLQGLVNEAIGYAKDEANALGPDGRCARTDRSPARPFLRRVVRAFARRRLLPPRRLSLGLAAGPAAQLSGTFHVAFALYLPAPSWT